MKLFQSLFYGLIAGITDILPVSSQAHKLILIKLFGMEQEPPELRLVIHLAVLGALYYGCHTQLLRIVRQRKLAKIPQKRRKRPLDTRLIMEMRLLQTMLVPVILGFVLYFKTSQWSGSLVVVSAMLLVNALILFAPSLLPSGNKDSRAMTRVDGLLLGCGAVLAALPGISPIGAMASIGRLRGVDRAYAVHIALLTDMAVSAGFLVHDVINLAAMGFSAVSFGILVGYLAASVAAFAGAFFAVRFLRGLSVHTGVDVFSYYCLGAAFFAFILYLTV